MKISSCISYILHFHPHYSYTRDSRVQMLVTQIIKAYDALVHNSYSVEIV